MAASVPRVSTDALPPKNRAQDLAGRTADCKVGTGTAAAAKGLFKAHHRDTWQDAQRTARLEPGRRH